MHNMSSSGAFDVISPLLVENDRDEKVPTAQGRIRGMSCCYELLPSNSQIAQIDSPSMCNFRTMSVQLLTTAEIGNG